MRWLILTLAAIPAFAGWAWVVFLGTSNGWWRAPLAPPDDAAAFMTAAAELIETDNRGNVAFRLIESGETAGEHFASIGEPVDADSRFQVASVSKWFTAWGVLRRVDAGDVDLDAPVSRYLTRWQLPESGFDNDQVTVRRLLSHTAGLTDGLGYLGFPADVPAQSLEASLSRAADAMDGADGRVRVGVEPGSEWLYSGGGYALLQLLLEEVSELPFATYMRREVLEPLGLHDSTFDLPDGAGDVAVSYDLSGNPAPRVRFTASSAAGLYTTAADLGRFVAAHLPGPDGEPAGRGVLRPETLALMRQPQAKAFGTEIWGLGVMLYAENGSGGHIIGHDGFNSPAASATVRLDPASGDAVVLLSTGNPGLTTRLSGEWVLWQTGRLDVASFYGSTGRMFLVVAAGWAVIVLLVLLTGWLTNRRHPPAGAIS
jgi:CubicO group peptidase (beta-lactamase class C family)